MSATIGVLLGAPASANPTSTCQELLTDEFFGTFGTVSAVQQTRDLQGPVSGYTYAPGGNSSEGQYVVTSDAWGSQSWNGLGQRVIGHTDGTTEDAYLLVNGSTSVGVFFEQSLDVARNKDFEVGAWFFNWTNAAFDTPGSRPTLALRIFDSTGTTLLGEAVQADILADGNWHQAFAVVNSGNNDSIVVRAVNLSTQAGGNDFVMDDLSVKALTTPCVATDFSDAPISTTSYGSASHEIDPAIYMGADVTAEETDFDSANADGDADDGASLPILTQGQTATIPVTVAGAGGFLQAWIDWNDNGSFADAGEQIAIDAQDGGAGDTDAVAGTISLSVPVPATASTTPTFARFRWSTSSGVGSGGLAIDGEVEDYALTVSASGGGGGGGASTFCEAQGYSLVGGNLIGGGSFTVQGDLASNISGATTGYTHYTGGGFVDGWPNDGNWEPDNGKYLITSRTGPVRYFQNFGSAWHDQVGVRNATDSTDKFMVINGDLSAGDVFQLQVNVTAGVIYEFSAYVTNLISRVQGDIEPNVAFEYSTNGGASWDTLFETGNIPARTDAQGPLWEQQYGYVTPSATGTMLIRLNSIAPGGNGNDFAIDELVFQGCSGNPLSAGDPDYSDAPTSGTSYGDATHAIVGGVQLGAAIDGESASIANADASGDGADDDGVTLPALTRGQTATIPVSVAGAGGYLQAWIDWNDNGSFADAGEQIALDVQDGGAGDTDAVAGTISLSVPVPATASTDPTFARLRWSTTSGLGISGAASDGEVEDYQLTVNPAPAGPFSCTSDFFISAANPAYMVRLDLSTDPVTETTIVNAGGFGFNRVNATAFNTADNYIYAFQRLGAHTLLQIASDGSVTQLGAVPGITAEIIAGDFNAATGEYIINTVNGTYSVDIATLTATPINDIGDIADIAYNPVDGNFYGIRTNGNVARIEPGSGYAVTTDVAPNPAGGGVTGATFFDNAGNFFVLNNGTQTLYAVDLATGESAIVTDGIGATDNNDGAACSAAAAFVGTISGRVFEDGNFNNTDDGETGYANVTVSLYQDNGTPGNFGDDTLLGQRVSAVDGSYAFAQVNALGGQTYRVEVDTADPDIPAGVTLGTTNPVEGVTVTAGGTTDVDFGFDPSSYMPVCSAAATSGMSLAGTASLGGQGQIILTPNAGNQAGLAWSSGRINLNNPFSMEFSVYLGTNTEVGADGIGFAFHNDPAGSAAVGSFGGALGIGGLAPAVAIEFDTFDNNNSPFGPNPTFNDTTPNDHAVIYDPLNYSDGGGGGPASLIGSVVDLGELEDGAWHPVVVNWDPATNTLSYTVDGSAGDSVVRDMINTDFGGNPLVYYGFAAGTGAYTNEHQVCIEDAPAFADTDYSDAPAVYQDATHVIVSGVQLGAAIDGEMTSIASVDASGDGADDDGVTLPTLTLGLAGTVSVDVSGAGGYLQGWIDWNQDGDFADLGEELLTNVQDNGVGDSDLTVGTIGFTVTPALATPTGTTFARFRWSTTSGIGSTGVAGDGEVEDYEVTIQASGGGGGSNGTLNYANSGTGANPGSLAILDWATSGLADGIRDGDTVNFALPSCRTGTLTATFSNVVNPANAETYLPTDLNTWAGASFAYSYNTAGTGEALYGGDNADTSFTIDWSMTVDGASVTPDIFVIDAESTNGAGEFLSATTNGGNWALIESAGGTDYVVAGTGTQTFTITKTENPSNSPLLLSENTTRTDIAIEAGGRQAVAFGVLLPCDYGDANVAGSPSHAFWQRPDAGGGLTFDDTLYLGSTPPDAETGPRPTADASGDDVDALGDDEDGVSSFPTLTEGDTSYTLPRASITANGTGTIHAWIDFNGDGTFASTEYAQTAVSGGVVAQNLYWKDQTTMSAGTTFARLRFTSDGAINASTPGGAASDGEVEDYRVTVSSEPFVAGASLCTAPLPTGLPLDVSGLSGSGGYFDRNTAGDKVVGVTASGLSTVGGNGTETVVNGATSEVIRFQANPFVHGSRATQSWTFDRQTGIDLAAGSAYGAPDSNMNRSFDRLVFRAYGTTAGFSWVMNSSLNGSYTISADGRTLAIEADAGNTAADFTQFDVSTSGALTRLDITKESEIGGSFLDSTQFAMTVPACDVDLSDAPVSYGEARHQTGNGTRLGSAVDGETASIASANADGDGADDDGVSFGTLNIGESGTISVSVAGPGYLNAWIDLDGSGAFDSPAEQIATDLVDYDADGTIPLALDIPAWATTGQTFARFRWSADFGIQATGAAADGEVEDYALTFGAAGTGGTRLSGTIFQDNGPGTAHDGIINAGEATGQFASVSILLAADSSLVAVGPVNPDGSWEAVLPEGFSSEIRVVASPAIGYLSASEAPGALPGLNNPSATDGAVVFTPVANSTYAGIDFGLIQTPILTQNQTGVVGAGQIIELPHVYTATSDGSVSFALVDETSTPAGAFSSLILSDTDCNGSGDAIQSGAVAVSAGQQICLVVRTQAGGGVGDASSHLYGIVATTAFTGTDILSSLRNDDRLGSSSRSVLHLEKLVRNLTAGTPEGRSNTGSPNDILEYRLVLMNPTGEAASNVRVTDATPAFTTLSSPVSSPVAVVPGMTCTLTAPSGGANVAGYAGTISWTCPGTFPAGETGNLIFRVRISP